MNYFWSRRDFLFQSGGGVSGLALAYLLHKEGLLAAESQRSLLSGPLTIIQPDGLRARPASTSSLVSAPFVR